MLSSNSCPDSSARIAWSYRTVSLFLPRSPYVIGTKKEMRTRTMWSYFVTDLSQPDIELFDLLNRTTSILCLRINCQNARRFFRAAAAACEIFPWWAARSSSIPVLSNCETNFSFLSWKDSGIAEVVVGKSISEAPNWDLSASTTAR